jgi:hypothetical protein
VVNDRAKNVILRLRAELASVADAVAAQLTAVADVLTERDRQEFKWGEQNHPIVGKAARRGFLAGKKECERLGIIGADEARERCDRAHRNGEGTYTHIIIEELAEAIEASTDHGDASVQSREEWVQVAAVALAIVERIDRARNSGGVP